MRIIIERLENSIVVVELHDGQTLNVPRALLPNAAEGDVYLIEKDVIETEARGKRINEKMNRLFTD